MLQHFPNVHTPVWCLEMWNQTSIAAQFKVSPPMRGQGKVGRGRPPLPMASLSPNLFCLMPAGQWSLYMRKRRKGVHLCVCQVQSNLLTAALGWGRGGTVSKCSCVSGKPQLFSKSDRRSSLLLLGRSGGSRYDSSSSGLASSGRSCEEKKHNIQSGVQIFQIFHLHFFKNTDWFNYQHCFHIFNTGQDSRLTMARACRTPPGCPNCWKKGWRTGRRGDGCWGRAVAAAVAEEAVLVVRAEEARCGVAAAPTGCQGVETHASSAARVRATGHCRQSEVSAERREIVSLWQWLVQDIKSL